MNDLIYTENGYVDVALMVREITWNVTSTEIRCIDTYRLNGVIVREYVHVKIV